MRAFLSRQAGWTAGRAGFGSGWRHGKWAGTPSIHPVRQNTDLALPKEPSPMGFSICSSSK